MTKQVRIENADTSDHKLVVELWDRGSDGAPDQLVKTIHLDYPTALTQDTYVWKERYLVVREA